MRKLLAVVSVGMDGRRYCGLRILVAVSVTDMIYGLIFVGSSYGCWIFVCVLRLGCCGFMPLESSWWINAAWGSNGGGNGKTMV